MATKFLTELKAILVQIEQTEVRKVAENPHDYNPNRHRIPLDFCHRLIKFL
jgi:hypothetical protein